MVKVTTFAKVAGAGAAVMFIASCGVSDANIEEVCDKTNSALATDLASLNCDCFVEQVNEKLASDEKKALIETYADLEEGVDPANIEGAENFPSEKMAEVFTACFEENAGN